MSNNPNNNSGNAGMIILLVIFMLFAFASCSDSGSSKKSYAEQYGYSVEDFYYKGSNGLWYKR